MLNKFRTSPAEAERTSATEQPVRPDAPPVPPQTVATTAEATIISAGITVVGKISGEGAINIFGRLEGELRAANVMISNGAQVEGEVFADDLTIGGHVKGTIHANRVKLTSTSVVEGDIFHRSLAIEENARFEGSSRRQDTVIDTHMTVAETQPESQTRLTAIDSGFKTNGSLGHESDLYQSNGSLS